MIKTRFQYAISLIAVIIFILAVMLTVSHFNTPTEHTTVSKPLPPEPTLPTADYHILFSGSAPTVENACDFSFADQGVVSEFVFHSSFFYHSRLTPTLKRQKQLSDNTLCSYGLFSKNDSAIALFHANVTSLNAAESLAHLLLCYSDYFPVLVIGSFSEEASSLLCNVVDLERTDMQSYTLLYTNLSSVSGSVNGIVSFTVTVPPYSLDLQKPMVAITYDDGPCEATETLLQTLQKHRAKATFYVLGAQTDLFPDAVKAIFLSHSEIGNHSNLHEIFSDNKPSIIQKTLEDTNRKLRTLIGIGAATVRPPTGATEDRNQNPLSVGYPIILWDIDTEDYRPEMTTDRLMASVFDRLRDGSIILMHDIHQTTIDSADQLLEALHAAGYQTVTVSELLEFKADEVQTDRVYRNALEAPTLH